MPNRAPKHLRILCDRWGFADLNAKFSGLWTLDYGPGKRDGDTSNEIPFKSGSNPRSLSLGRSNRTESPELYPPTESLCVKRTSGEAG